MSDDVTSDTEQASKDGTLTDVVGGACAPAADETLATSDDVKPTSPLGKTTSTLSGLLGGEKYPKSDSNVKENVPCKDDHVELSNKKKRSPCPWQIQPPPRPFKKARYAWQIKNYEHTVSRMKKSLAQQNQASSMGKGSSCSDVQSEAEDSKHCASSASHYPGLYNNLPAAYSSSFYNPLLRWSKTASAASGVDIPVNRMLHNIFFSGNEPTSGLHPLLMMSLAEGNTAAFNENLACEDLPRDGAPLLLSDVPSGIGGVGSPGMQSPPTSDYDSSSDEASLGDDLMPEPQMMSHLPPSYPAMQQQQHLMNSPQSQHYLSNAQSAHQQMLHQQQQNTLSCAQFPHMNGIPPRCDSPMDVPMNRRMTHVPDDPPSPHLHYEHHSPDHSTPEANLAFHNAMMNCPLSMTNRQLFSLQLHNFCERMQASNNFFPFNQSYQQYRSNCARISEYVDEDNSLSTESSKLVIEKDALSSKADDHELAVQLKEDSVTESNVNKDSYEFRESPAIYGGEKNLRVVGEHNSATRVVDYTDERNESLLPEVERSVKKSPNETSAGVFAYETLEREPSTRSHVSADVMHRANSEVSSSDASTKNLHAGEENVSPKVASEEAQKSLSRTAMSGVQKEFADTRGKVQELKTRSSNEDRTFSKEKELPKSDLLRPRGDEISERKTEHRSAGVEDVSVTFGDGERPSPSRHQREREDCVSSSAIQNTQVDKSNGCEKPSKCESENRTSSTGFSLENDSVTNSAEEVRVSAEDPAKCDNKCKLEASDDTGDSCSLASFSPKCLNCVSGCDDCSRNLSDKTLEPPNSRLTLLTCSCVIAKQCSDDASIAPTGIASSVSSRESVDRSLGHCDNLIEVTSQSSELAHKKRKTDPLKDVHCGSDFDECSCSDGSSRIRSCCSANKVGDTGKVRQAQPNDSHVGSADEKSSSPTEDSADTKVSDKTASALVHHICDNNNDKYFLDQTFHVAIKQGLGYQKA